jgi:hypothetical protein
VKPLVSESKTRQRLVSSIKGKVKEKKLSRGWNFSTFAAHFIEQDLF